MPFFNNFTGGLISGGQNLLLQIGSTVRNFALAAGEYVFTGSDGSTPAKLLGASPTDSDVSAFTTVSYVLGKVSASQDSGKMSFNVAYNAAGLSSQSVPTGCTVERVDVSIATPFSNGGTPVGIDVGIDGGAAGAYANNIPASNSGIAMIDVSSGAGSKVTGAAHASATAGSAVVTVFWRRNSSP